MSKKEMLQKVTINETKYMFCKEIRDNPSIRQSFNKLCEETFEGLSFEFWYQQGYWQNLYIPYVLLAEGEVVANASANLISFSMAEEEKLYLQIGTVMTKLNYRNKGLSRYLIQQILSDWEDKVEDIYLYANSSVLDFYPKFGFAPIEEFQVKLSVEPQKSNIKQLDMTIPEDIALLLDCFQQSNPYSKVAMWKNEGLLMFYCSQFLKEGIYYLPQEKTIVILEQSEETTICYDIFGQSKKSLRELIEMVLPAEETEVLLGFTPKELMIGTMEKVPTNDSVLFHRNLDNKIFIENTFRFPLLSQA